MDKSFVNQYAVSKTLRFELKPIGRTMEHFSKKKFLQQDIERSEDYKTVKKIIDRYHKEYMELALANQNLDIKLIENYYKLYKTSNLEDKQKKRVGERNRKYT